MSTVFYARELLLLIVLLFSAVADVLDYKVPNRIIIFGFIVITALNVIYPPKIDLSAIGLCVFILLLLLACWKKRAIGAGDIKLFSLIFFTRPDESGFLIILFAFVFGAVMGIIKLIKGAVKNEKVKNTIPLAACTFLGALTEMIVCGTG